MLIYIYIIQISKAIHTDNNVNIEKGYALVLAIILKFNINITFLYYK